MGAYIIKKEKSMIKQLSMLFFLYLILISSCFLVSAGAESATVDTKMKIKYCEIALSDIDVSQWKFQSSTGTEESDVFKPWNSTEQEGIFMRIDNQNLNLGENSSYQTTRYTPNRTWFNEFNAGDGTESNIPIINVGVGKDKWIYIRCKFKVGDYRIFLYDYGFEHVGFLTDDFNLTTGIIPFNTQSPTVPRYSIFGTALVFDYNSGQVNNLNPDEEGFFPNTEPYIIYKSKNLAEKPTSWFVFSMWWLVRELGRINLVSEPYPGSILYVNNSNPNFAPQNFLKPRMEYPIFRKDETIGVTTQGTYLDEIELIPGRNYSMTIPFKNDYNTALNIGFWYQIVPNDWLKSRGIGRGDIELFPAQDWQSQTITFPPGETKNLTNSYVILDGYIIGQSYQTTYFNNTNDPTGNWYYSWPVLGSEAYPYISFLAIDPRIQLRRIGGNYEPIFNITVDLYAENWTYNLNILEDDYELEGRIYNESMIPENLRFSKNYSLLSNLNKGSTTPFNWIVPVDPSWRSGRYYISFLAKMKKDLSHPEFKDKYISSYGGSPYFKPGDIAYQYGNTLKFGFDSRRDSEKIIIFNPSFYETDVSLSVKNWSDNNNFTLSWDGVNFGKNPSTTIHLYPLRSKDITFYVNATYEPWVTSPLQENLEIKASAEINTGGEIVNKENQLNFILDVSNLNLNWFNLNPLGYSPEFIPLDNIDSVKNQDIIVSWGIEGSDSGILNNIGESYVVNLTLLNETDRTVLKKTGGIFSVNGKETKTLSLNYDFRFGKYLIIFDLDSKNDIDETDSNGMERESENYNEYSLPIIVDGCYYNESDGNIYLYNFWGELVKDDCSKCECPYDLICIKGLGHCANTSGECSFDNIVDCNNLTAHINYACAWECANGNCPPNPNINIGNCSACSNIFDGCAGYNNNVTCKEDPCYKAETIDCVWASCNISEEHYCYWDNDDKCKFRGYIDGALCNYSAKILSECREGRDIMIINYTGFPTANCPSKTIRYSCPKTVRLPFFNIFNIIAAIVLMTITYYFYLSKKVHHKKI